MVVKYAVGPGVRGGKTVRKEQVINLLRVGLMATGNGKMKRKKEITKTQYMENNFKVLRYIAQLLVCAFLLGVVIFSLPL